MQINEGPSGHARGSFEMSHSQPASKKEQINLISLDTSSIVRVLWVLAFLLFTINIAAQWVVYMTEQPIISKGVRFFYFDSENNVPSAFSTLLLLIAGLLLTVITILKKGQPGAMVFHWAILSAGFLVMAADEELSFHEQLIFPVRALLGNGNYGIFYYAWVIPAMGMVAALGLFFLKFLLRLPVKTALHFVVAATLFLGGSIGIELIGGRYDELYGQDTFTYSLIATCEESLEMAGVILFIRALLIYISDTIKEVQFRVVGTKRGGSCA